MKRKLFFGLLAAAAVTFTACQKDEVLSQLPQDNEISFNTYLGRDAQVKGTIVETAQLKTQGFGVFAYYTGTTAASGYTFPATPNFLDNEKVYWDNTNSKWKYDNTKYWPNSANEKISFYAYGPYDDPTAGASNAISVTTAAGQKPVLTYTVDNGITKHMDVLFAPAQEDKTKASGTEPFVFQHALSRIEFEVKTTADYSDAATITLNSVTLSGDFYKKGDLNLGGNAVNWTNTDTEAKSFTISDTRAVTISERTVEHTLGTTEYIMIIPQEFDANDLNLNVNYNVQYGSQTPIANNVTKPLSAITFVQGNAYKIIISIGMNEVTFSASVTGWNESHAGFTPGTGIDI